MSFIPISTTNQRIVPPSGSKNSKIAIVGEAPGAYENQQLKPFVGPAGGVLEQCLHSAGLIKSECYLTNVVKVQPKGNDIKPFFDGKNFTAAGQEWVDQLYGELDECEANIIVACGATAFAALAGLNKILKYRGYIFESIGLRSSRKVLPTIHPAASLRGNYIWRHLISSDLRKAKEESGFRELKRPQRQLIYEWANVEEVLEWLAYYEKQSIVCFDIEVLNYELSCIGFSSSHDIACTVPISDRWTELDELLIWRAIQRVLANPNSTKVAQNAIFDCHFLLTKCGIEVRGPIRDTMIAHSVMFPELPKGLAFLGSIYCGAQSYWKDTVKFTNIKEES